MLCAVVAGAVRAVRHPGQQLPRGGAGARERIGDAHPSKRVMHALTEVRREADRG